MSGTMMPTMCQILVVSNDPIKFKNLLNFSYAVLRARRTIAVMRPLVLRLLLHDHTQAAGVWKTDAVNI